MSEAAREDSASPPSIYVVRHDDILLFVSHKHVLAALWCALKNLELTEFQSQMDEGLTANEILMYLLERLRKH